MKNLFKKFAVMFLVVICAVGFVGCANNKGKDEGNTAKEPEKVSNVTYPITITDSFGKELTIEKEPTKIVSVAPNITELIFKLGAEDKLVGRTNYCDYPAEVSSIESIGTLRTPDIEKIISLEPDLVITSTHFNEENGAKLNEAGINVISLYEENDVNGVYTIIDTLGKITNKQSEADKTVAEMKATLSEVETKINGLEQPTVYYVVGYGEGGDFTAPVNTFVGQLIKLAGGNNIVPASDNWGYSLEALLEADPHIIVVRKGDKDNFMATEGYKELTAVKEGRVYEIDNNLLDRQGYRNAEGVLTLAKIFHPEAFK